VKSHEGLKFSLGQTWCRCFKRAGAAEISGRACRRYKRVGNRIHRRDRAGRSRDYQASDCYCDCRELPRTHFPLLYSYNSSAARSIPGRVWHGPPYIRALRVADAATDFLAGERGDVAVEKAEINASADVPGDRAVFGGRG